MSTNGVMVDLFDLVALRAPISDVQDNEAVSLPASLDNY